MSDPKDSRLDQASHDRIYTRKVLPRSGFNETTAQAHPKAIVLAGQPGAGKGGLERAARSEFKGDAVTVDLDALRGYHRDVGKLRETYPYDWADHTQEDAKQWTNRLREEVSDGKRNVILDTTLGNAGKAVKEIREFQAKGYEIEIRAVATHKLESELGVDRRFTEDLVKKGHGRHVPNNVHDSAYESLPASLDEVRAKTGARIRIYNREGQELYDSRTSPLKPSVALEQAREARMQDPAITRATAKNWREQQEFHRELPDTLERNPRITPQTAQNLLEEHKALKIEPGVQANTAKAAAVDHAVRIEPAAVRARLGLKLAGEAAVAYDGYTSVREASQLLEQGNATGAQSKVLHFGARTGGMLAGGTLGFEAGAALGIETGPGALLTGTIGGIAGAVASDKIMDAVDQARIYSQRGSDGNRWHLDPQHPERGWSRMVQTNEIDLQGIPNELGMPTYKWQTLHADARLSDELNYKASGKAVEMALASAPALQDPFTQPSNRNDGPGDDWKRDSTTRQWSRSVLDPATVYTETPIWQTEPSSATRGAQLDQAAKATIADNIAHGPQAIAQHYQAAYDQYGWKQYGPVPAAVTSAAHTPPSQLPASDGHTYTQGSNGQWSTPGTLWGSNTAQGHVRDELNATRRQVQASATATAAPSPSMADKGHPGHALYAQAQTGLRQYNSAHKIAMSDERTNNMAAALAVAAVSKGLTHIDHVEPGGSKGEKLFAVQGKPGDAHSKIIDVPTVQAMATPLAQSSQSFEKVQASQQKEQPAQQQPQPQRQQQPAISH